MIQVSTLQKFLLDYKKAFPEQNFHVINLSMFLVSKMYSDMEWPDHLKLLGATNVLTEVIKSSDTDLSIEDSGDSLILTVDNRPFTTTNKNFQMADLLIKAGKRFVKGSSNGI